jgi:hypothetical protein
MIASIFDATNDVNSARSLYLALSEFASDNGTETFTESIAQIARRAGVSYRTTTSFMKRFESLKLIAIVRQTFPGTKLQAPNSYTMLGNSCLSVGNELLSSLPRVQRKKRKENKDLSKKNPKNLPTPTSEPYRTDEEIAKAKQIAHDCITKLRKQFRMQ